MDCAKELRAGETCGRPADHGGQHRTARSMNRRNIHKRHDNQKARLLRERAGWVDRRTLRRTMNSDEVVEHVRSQPGWEPADDDYYARKRADGLLP